MTMSAVPAIPTAAPAAPPAAADSGGGDAPEVDSGSGGGDDGGFDVEEAREEAARALSGDEAPEKPKAKPPEKPKEAEAGTAEELDREWTRFRAQEKRWKDTRKEEHGAIEKTKAELAARDAEFAQKEQAYNARIELGRKNPLSMLKEAGWEWPQLIAYVDSQGEIPHDKLVRDMKLEYDKELEKTRAEVEAIKKEKQQEARAKQIREFESAVETEVTTTLDSFPRLKAFHAAMTAKGKPHQVLNAVFKHLDDSAKQKNFLAPSQAMRYYEDQLEEAGLYTPVAAPGGVNQLEAVKPQVEKLAPLSNGDSGERASTPLVEDDDGEFDAEAARRRARATLFG